MSSAFGATAQARGTASRCGYLPSSDYPTGALTTRPAELDSPRVSCYFGVGTYPVAEVGADDSENRRISYCGSS